MSKYSSANFTNMIMKKVMDGLRPDGDIIISYTENDIKEKCNFSMTDDTEPDQSKVRVSREYCGRERSHLLAIVSCCCNL